MAAGKGQFFTVWKCFRCACTQGAWGSAHSSFFFLVTRLPGENPRWGARPGQRGACAGSCQQRPGCPRPCPRPPPGHPRGTAPAIAAQAPRSGGYSHHPWLAAAAAGDVDGGDEAPRDGALLVAEAAGGGDTVCEGRERQTALVRPQATAQALAPPAFGVPQGFAISRVPPHLASYSLAVAPQETPGPKPESQHWRWSPAPSPPHSHEGPR